MPDATRAAPVLTPAWRWLAALLIVVAAINLPFSLVAAVLMTDPPVTPGMLARSLAVFSLLPAGVTWALLRLFRASIEVRDGALEIARAGLTIGVPCSAIDAVLPWRLPFPATGLSLRLKTGKTLPFGIASPRPDALLDLLGESEGSPAASLVRQHPSIVYARERARRSRLTWRRFLLKFVVFALVPTAPLFNVHQSIAYGGTLGQYYLQGPRAYLTTFAIYWGTVTLYLICYASVWRGLAEGSALGAAWLAPARAGRVRQVAEWACAALYYGGVPLLLLWRFLA